MTSDNITSDLPSWPEIEDEEDWAGILVGNGASIAVWDRFRYASLFAEASGGGIPNPLTAEDQALFKSFDTENFEMVLSALLIAHRVGTSLGQHTAVIEERYESIRRALMEAVQAVHVPWLDVPEATLSAVKEALSEYEQVFSTNYDLLIYWSIMHGGPEGFVDYFWEDGGHFDPSNTEVWHKATRVHYLHGGIHLYRRPSGRTFKRRREEWKDLLSLFAQPLPDGSTPQIITEASPADKINAIARSDYLSFAYSEFAQSNGPMVILGHSLGASDSHLSHTMTRWADRTIAIGLLRGSDDQVRDEKLRHLRQLKKPRLLFFDAQTHPLADPTLRVTARP